VGNKEKLFLRIGIVVTVLSLIILPPTLAIYRDNLDLSTDVALADWEVSLNQTGENSLLEVVPGTANDTDTYTLNIQSLSEVDVKYTIIISNLPSGVEVALDDGTFQVQTNNTVTFTNAGTILYTDASDVKSHVLKFKATSGASIVNNQTVDINVLVEQIL